MHSFKGFKSFQSQKCDNINLLDIITNSKQSQKNIYTFQQFKQWFNGVDFNQVNQQHIKSKLKKPKSFQIADHSLKYSNQNQQQNFGLLISGPILDLAQKKRKISIQQHQKAFNLYQHQEAQVSVRQSSVKSSRSFNGYQQINQYQIRQKIGKGAFSEVFQAIDVQSEQKKKYAIKVMQSKRLKKKFFRRNSHQFKDNFQISNLQKQQSARDYDGNSSEFVNNQIAILKKINHQFITKLYEVILDRQNGKAYLVLQYCPNGFINENKNKLSKGGHMYRKLLQSECKRYFKQLALAINYIHTIVKIAHRDIKPQNILISQNDEVKLSDFGLGTDQLQTDQYSGTRLYMPPENSFSEGKKIVKTQAADIWAVGISLLIMITGETPEYKNNQIVDLQKILSELNVVSPQLKNFLKRCLQPNPQQRMDSDQLLAHPWICQDSFQLLIRKTLVQQFQFVVSSQQEKQAIKDVLIKKQKNNFLSLGV